MSQDFVYIIPIILIIYLLINHDGVKEFFTLIPVRSQVDGFIYPVVSKYYDKELAANAIGEMNTFSLKLIKKLKEVYLDTPNILNKPISLNNEVKNLSSRAYLEYKKGRDAITILLNRYNTKSFKENDSDNPAKTSYTTDKGRIITLCLREKVSGQNKLHDLDLIKFVLLHELAHIITVRYDHDFSFWCNFKFLLEFCEKHDLYKAVDYNKYNTVYCGLLIEYSPVTDPQIPSYFY